MKISDVVILQSPSCKKAVRSFAKNTLTENHQYVFALHTDTDSPHVHLTVKNLGFDGKRLHVRKGLPQVWREQFADK
ncbi:relaxase/mobilization nuclease domain-containing protein [Shewanella sp. 202IG2-18]|uniref:relaxase/mobilization nuclease domain-containing protein n=1 Tax=Parashewanella hymeniacidonis TaxID=2807618 RepID=UPI0019611CEA|nr:relaxase/mobilization nuclease domain-containing protein [Parashewanella hymeniacidonis]MBM7072426.1 relaxase/mobilization nuclease domain-containing protein [Parashewanella hymeniacidonis]